MALIDRKWLRLGRRAAEPRRDTMPFPGFSGNRRPDKPVAKPTPRALRRFARTPYARRAINAVKNPIAMLDWEIVPLPGVAENAELKRQIEAASYCLHHPNGDDGFRSFSERVVEDVLTGAGAFETQLSGDPLRPLWMWPADGLSIQINPLWDGSSATPRYLQSISPSLMLGTSDRTVPLRDDELVYITPNPSTSTPFGLGPLEVAFTSIDRQIETGLFAAKVAGNARAGIAVDLGEDVDAAAMAAFRVYWTNDVEGQGKVPIIGTKNGKVTRLYPEGDKALFLQYQEFLKTEIALAFDLSPMNLGVERDVNRSTAEVGSERDWDQAIKPRAREFEAVLTKVIQRRLGFSQLRFRYLGLDREDEKRAAEIYAIEYQAGATTPNEYRETRSRPPLTTAFADLTGVDVTIAKAAANGAKEVDDPNLQPWRPAPKPDPTEA